MCEPNAYANGEFVMAVLWTEDFEDAGGATSQVGVTRSAQQHASANGTFDPADAADFSFRSNQTEGATLTNPFTNLQGSYAWMAHDVDGIPGFTGSDTDVLNWAGIDITGQTNLTFSGFFGASSIAGIGFGSWDDQDFISIEVQIDGGGFTEILRFEGNVAGNVGDLAVDTNGDGLGDGTSLTEALALFSNIAIAGTGTTLDLRITFEADGGQEELAFDQFQISGDNSGPINGTPNADNLQGTLGDDVINGLDGNDTLSGGGTTETDGGNDTLNGGEGNDRLFGQGGEDILNGEGGNDQLWGQEGADALDGGTGIDGAYYINATGAVSLNVVTGGTAGHAAGDTYVSIERFIGSQFGDTLDGGAANDFLYGLGGDDTINGAGGDDILVGGLGIDTINGGDDNDTISGSQGGDILNGDAGTDTLRGGSGDDMLNGGNDNDSLDGGSGADALDGGAGVDLAIYTSATAGVIASLDAGGTGGDAMGDTFADIENLYGSYFDDQLQGDSANNIIVGLSGNDELDGLAGNDRLIGSAGDDRLNGGEGNDILIGQADADTFIFNGSSGQNELDRIIDFEDGTDMIELFFFGNVDSFADLTLTQVGNHVRIEEDTDSTGGLNDSAILVFNTVVADLTADDFNIIAAPQGEPLGDDFANAGATADLYAGIPDAALLVAFVDDTWQLDITDGLYDIFL